MACPRPIIMATGSFRQGGTKRSGPERTEVSSLLQLTTARASTCKFGRLLFVYLVLLQQDSLSWDSS